METSTLFAYQQEAETLTLSIINITVKLAFIQFDMAYQSSCIRTYEW